MNKKVGREFEFKTRDRQIAGLKTVKRVGAEKEKVIGL